MDVKYHTRGRNENLNENITAIIGPIQGHRINHPVPCSYFFSKSITGRTRKNAINNGFFPGKVSKRETGSQVKGHASG